MSTNSSLSEDSNWVFEEPVPWVACTVRDCGWKKPEVVGETDYCRNHHFVCECGTLNEGIGLLTWAYTPASLGPRMEMTVHRCMSCATVYIKYFDDFVKGTFDNPNRETEK